MSTRVEFATKRYVPVSRKGAVALTALEKHTKGFRPDPDGGISQFEGCKLIITIEEWLRNPTS